jgi:ABC-2 type transport system permease protein
VIVNGFFVAAFALVVGGLIVGIHVPPSSVAPLALATAICAFSCTGLGLLGAAFGLLMREQAVLANVMFGFLLIFTGANVPVSALPGWMQSVSEVLPFTHGIEAAREIADGAPLADVADLLATEIAIGVVFGTVGYVLIRGAERLSLRHATLDRA